MAPDVANEELSPSPEAWRTAQAELAGARLALAGAPAGMSRQAPYDRLLAAEQLCTTLVHTWLARAFELEIVAEPTLVLSLDVDGVLEDEAEGFSATGLAGAAALRLLQLGRVAVLLNTARSIGEVRQRVMQFRLLGGVGAFGAAIWDGVFSGEHALLDPRGAAQLERLRAFFCADPELVLHSAHPHAVRASRILDGAPAPIAGPKARQLLDDNALGDLAFWVAPRHTDFVDRRPDKGIGLHRLLAELRLTRLPLAAVGDATCDVPMLRPAKLAFLPAATLPAYIPPKRQRLVRSRYLGDQALWDVACHLVPNVALQRRVHAMAQNVNIPEWFPASLSHRVPSTMGWFPRLTAALTSARPAPRDRGWDY